MLYVAVFPTPVCTYPRQFVVLPCEDVIGCCVVPTVPPLQLLIPLQLASHAVNNTQPESRSTIKIHMSVALFHVCEFEIWRFPHIVSSSFMLRSKPEFNHFLSDVSSTPILMSNYHQKYKTKEV